MGDSYGVWDGRVHAAVFNMSNRQGPIVWHKELCSTLYGSLDGRGVLGERICIHVWLSSFAVHLKLSQHC